MWTLIVGLAAAAAALHEASSVQSLQVDERAPATEKHRGYSPALPLDTRPATK